MNSILSTITLRWRRFRAFHARQHPLDVAVVYVALILAAVVILFPPSSVPESLAVGGYSAVNVLGPDNFTNASDWDLFGDPGVIANGMVYDEEGETIYIAGEAGAMGGVSRRCFNEASATVCNSDASWSASFSGVDMGTIVLDTTGSSRVLYAASTGTKIYRCDIAASSCEDGGDWSEVYDIGGPSEIQALAVSDGVLFIGTDVEASTTIIGNCTLSSDCDEAGDFDFGFTNLNERITALFADTDNEILYGGFNDSIRRCDQASGCDDDTDWIPVASPSSSVLSFTADEDNDVIYAGTGSQVLRCEISSSCDEDADWIPAFDSGYSADGLLWDPTTETVYVVDDGAESMFLCETESACDGDASWQRATVPNTVYARQFVRDTSTGMLYAAGESGGGTYAYECDPDSGCNEASELSGAGDSADLVYDATFQQVFVVDRNNSRILVYDLQDIDDGEYHVNIVGQYDLNDELGCNRGGSAAADTLCFPGAVAYDDTPSAERLFIADTGNNRVLVYDVSDGLAGGEPAANVLGQINFTNTDCASEPGANEVCQVSGLYYDGDNERLFVSSADLGDVRVFDLSDGVTDYEPAIAVLGNADFGSGGCALSQWRLCEPAGLGYDAAGERLFVVDNDNNRIMVWDVAIPVVNGATASFVLGQPDFDTADSETSVTGLASPRDATYNAATGRLYVSDQDNERIMVWDVAGISNGEDAVDVIGQDNFDTADSGTSASLVQGVDGVAIGEATYDVIVHDGGNGRVLFFDVSPPDSDVSHSTADAVDIGFTPQRILVNRDEESSDSRNVLVTIYAVNSDTFTGTVDVILSNDPQFRTFIPFRYAIPERAADGNLIRNPWPKTVAWDMCFGSPAGEPCDTGSKTVYARFYVNVPPPEPAFRPGGSGPVPTPFSPQSGLPNQ